MLSTVCVKVGLHIGWGTHTAGAIQFTAKMTQQAPNSAAHGEDPGNGMLAIFRTQWKQELGKDTATATVSGAGDTNHTSGGGHAIINNMGPIQTSLFWIRDVFWLGPLAPLVLVHPGAKHITGRCCAILIDWYAYCVAGTDWYAYCVAGTDWYAYCVAGTGASVARVLTSSGPSSTSQRALNRTFESKGSKRRSIDVGVKDPAPVEVVVEEVQPLFVIPCSADPHDSRQQLPAAGEPDAKSGLGPCGELVGVGDATSRGSCWRLLVGAGAGGAGGTDAARGAAQRCRRRQCYCACTVHVRLRTDVLANNLWHTVACRRRRRRRGLSEHVH